jgi:hypothetical protein
MHEKSPRRPDLEPAGTPLPADRAFVIQLRAQTDPGADLFVGRIEHMTSGEAIRFGSAESLLAFITTVLAPVAPPSGESSAPTESQGSLA